MVELVGSFFELQGALQNTSLWAFVTGRGSSDSPLTSLRVDRLKQQQPPQKSKWTRTQSLQPSRPLLKQLCLH